MKNKSKGRQRQPRAIWFLSLAVITAMIFCWFVLSGTLHKQLPTPSVTAVPFMLPVVSTVTANAQWRPQTQTFNGVPMALVPPGCFVMGMTANDIADLNRQNAENIFGDSGPQSQVCFDKPFWIDQDLATNAQFAQFKGTATFASTSTGNKRPRVNISWFEATAFCALRGARLPTEAEWEYAARGPDDLGYPWGNDFADDKAIYVGNSGEQTADVESKPKGVSWVGAFDMAGNVWQWTSSIYKNYPYKADDGRESYTDTSSARLRRGGSFANGSTLLPSTFRFRSGPFNEDSDFGFRCAHS